MLQGLEIKRWFLIRSRKQYGFNNMNQLEKSVGRGVVDNKQALAEPSKPREVSAQFQKKIQDATGSSITEFGEELFVLCVGASNLPAHPDKFIRCGHEGLLNTLTAMRPADEFEGMLITKIIALHRQGMLVLARVEMAQQLDQMESYVNMAAKLTRLQNESIEALNRHRRQGKQTVLVQHVNISGEGKAVLSNVVGGGVQEKQGYQPHG